MRIEIKRFNRRVDMLVGAFALCVAVGATIWTLTTQDSHSHYQASYLLLFLTTVLGSSTIFVPAPNIPVIIFNVNVLSPTLVVLYGGIRWGLSEITGYLAGRMGYLAVVDVSPKFEKL